MQRLRPPASGGQNGQVVAMMLERAADGRALAVHGDGRQTRSFTWVGDVVDGLERLGRMDEAVDGSGPLAGSAFNFASSVETSIADLAVQISALTGARSARVSRATRVIRVAAGPRWTRSSNVSAGKPARRSKMGYSARGAPFRTSGDRSPETNRWGSPSADQGHVDTRRRGPPRSWTPQAA